MQLVNVFTKIQMYKVMYMYNRTAHTTHTNLLKDQNILSLLKKSSPVPSVNSLCLELAGFHLFLDKVKR